MGPKKHLLAAKPTATPSDPYFANLQLLLHFDGTNGGTSFPDASPKARVPTVAGNAQTSTSSPLYGTASGLFDGVGDYLQYAIAAGDGVQSGDFTIEGFMKTTQTTGVAALFAIGNGGADAIGNIQIAVYMVNGKLRGSGSSASASVGTGDAATNVADGAVHHFALVRSGNVFNLYIDGTLGATVTNSITLSSQTTMYVGSSGTGAAYWYNGRLDEVRFTKGVARYTANFTAPAAAFPNS